MYSRHNDEKSVVAEGFIKTLKNKIYKYMTSKNVYIVKLNDIVNKYNNTLQFQIIERVLIKRGVGQIT